MIYVFLADGFEETEAIAPIDMLRRAKKEVVTVGVTGKVVTSSHGVPVTADITQDEIQLNDQLEMIVLPGGMPGTLNEGCHHLLCRAEPLFDCHLCSSVYSGTSGTVERQACCLLSGL